MKIQCLLERNGGTQLDIDGVEYDFQPDATGAHVCDVEDEEHIERFLSISEAYVEHGAETDKNDENKGVTGEGNTAPVTAPTKKVASKKTAKKVA